MSALRGNSFFERMIEGLGHLLSNVTCWIKEIPNYLKTQEMCDETVRINPLLLAYVPDHLRTQEMCIEIMHTMPDAFHRIPDHFKTQKMCIKAVEVDPWQLKDVPDHYKTQEMCDKSMRDYLFSLQQVADWFVTQEQIDIWYDDDYDYNNNNKLIKWYNGYQKRKAQKAKIKEELLPTTWHLDRVKDWCLSEGEKRCSK